MLAPDLRGHGESARRPASVELGAFVRDALVAAAVFAQRPIVIGQSLGGIIALALAAREPGSVRALVMVEASPSPNPDAAREVREWLGSWPVPFNSRKSAEEFFGCGEAGEAWAGGLAQTTLGLVPRFDADVVEEAVRLVTTTDLWPDWRALDCPALVVRGARGDLSAAEAHRMAASNPRARETEVAGAGHDVHLDEPAGFRAAVEPFVRDVLT